jgi:hypothetical protein
MTAPLADREIAFPFGRDRVVAMALAAAAMIAMIWPHLGYVPLWDGRVYANCVMDAAFSGVSMESLRCAGHPSQGWAAVLTVPQLFDPGNIALLNATNLALGIVALVAIRVVLARVFPGAAHARALDLVAAAAALNPVVLSTLLQPNVDFGVYVFFFVSLAGLLTPTVPGTSVALVGGILLVFSKETGLAAYGLAIAAAVVIEHVRSGVPLAQRWRAAGRRAGVLGVPLVLFAAHVLDWNRTHAQGAIWKHGWQKSSVDGFNFFDLSDPIFVSYAAGLFVIGFMWVTWLPVAADALLGIARMARRAANRAVDGSDPVVLAAITVLTFALTYLLSSFRTWSNLRYFAVLYPLFALMSYAALVRLGFSERLRMHAMRLVVLLTVLAAFRSADPLSRAVYGTFDTGVRRMYRMTSITGEFEGPGRDQLVYNLEFPGYHDVQNALYAQIKPTATTVIGTPRHVRWNIWSQLDATTFARSMRRTGIITPTYADEVDIAARRSPEAWFIDFSNHGAKDNALQALSLQYRITDSVTVVTGGQRIVARHLVRREAPVLP